jgi:lipopolysaccharide transport system permease protein
MGLAVLGLLMAWYHVPITAHAAAAIPLLVLLCAWAFAVMLTFAALQVRFRDVGVALPVLVQFWMFASPVIYPLSVVPERWRWWYDLNPMTGIIAALRDALLQRPLSDSSALAAAVVVTAIALPFAYAFFKRAEATIADVI